jgi:predicted GNAT family acetyltransferase
MADTVVHEKDLNRYTLMRDSKSIGFTEYEIHGNAIHFTHTEIEPSVREHGLGSELVRAALDQVRSETDYRVIALCPFVDDWIGNHPEYQDLTERS